MFVVAIGSEPGENTGVGIFSACKRNVADLQVISQCITIEICLIFVGSTRSQVR